MQERSVSVSKSYLCGYVYAILDAIESNDEG